MRGTGIRHEMHQGSVLRHAILGAGGVGLALGAALARGGHDVTLVTSHPDRATVSVEEGMRVIRARRPPRPPGAGSYEHHLVNALNVARRLRRGSFDVAHAFFPVDAWVAEEPARGHA